MHSFCLSAQVDIEDSEEETSSTDFDIEIIVIEVNKRENVLKPAQKRYL